MGVNTNTRIIEVFPVRRIQYELYGGRIFRCQIYWAIGSSDLYFGIYTPHNFSPSIYPLHAVCKSDAKIGTLAIVSLFTKDYCKDHRSLQ